MEHFYINKLLFILILPSTDDVNCPAIQQLLTVNVKPGIRFASTFVLHAVVIEN